MAGLLLLRMGVTRARVHILSNAPGPPAPPPRTENKMLRLHETLSESLYQNKNRSNEKLSVKIVLLVTLLATLTTGLFAQQHPPHILTAYLLLVWLLPMWSYVLGVRRRSPFLLLPWIFVACVLGMVAEMFLLWAAVSSIGSDPPVSLTGSPPCDLLLLLLLATPLPVLLSVPVRAFVYMDMAVRRSGSNSKPSFCLCCCSNKGQADEESAIQEEDSAEDEDDKPVEGTARDVNRPVNSIMITRFQSPPSFLSMADRAMGAMRGQMAQTGAVENETEGGRQETEAGDTIVADEVGVEASEEGVDVTNVAVVPLPLDLFDIGSIHVEDTSEEIEEHGEAVEGRVQNLEPLPPSYSHAEGLDQLPSYDEAEVNRVRIGPYVVVYDKQNRNLSTFKK